MDFDYSSLDLSGLRSKAVVDIYDWVDIVYAEAMLSTE